MALVRLTLDQVAARQIKGSRRAVLLVLCAAASRRHGWTTWLSQATIARRAGCSLDTVQRALKDLEGARLIHRRKRSTERGRITDLITVTAMGAAVDAWHAEREAKRGAQLPLPGIVPVAPPPPRTPEPPPSPRELPGPERRGQSRAIPGTEPLRTPAPLSRNLRQEVSSDPSGSRSDPGKGHSIPEPSPPPRRAPLDQVRAAVAALTLARRQPDAEPDHPDNLPASPPAPISRAPRPAARAIRPPQPPDFVALLARVRPPPDPEKGRSLGSERASPRPPDPPAAAPADSPDSTRYRGP